MFIRFTNYFINDTPLNQLLEKRSSFKYKKELKKVREKYTQHQQELPTRFVVFNFPRSGSNFLCSMLNNHPDILCHQEMFNPTRIFYAKNFPWLYGDFGSDKRKVLKDFYYGRAGLGSRFERDLNPEAFLMKIWQHNYKANSVGFNLFPNHVPNMARSLIKDKEVRKILLIRKNKVKCYVSRALARKTSVWADFANNSSKSKSKESPIQINIDANSLLSWNKKYDSYFDSLRQNLIDLEQPFFEVGYEDLIGPESQSTKSRLLDFIGVKQDLESLTPQSRKQNSRELSSIISNYAELKNKLKGSSLESLL